MSCNSVTSLCAASYAGMRSRPQAAGAGRLQPTGRLPPACGTSRAMRRGFVARRRRCATAGRRCRQAPVGEVVRQGPPGATGPIDVEDGACHVATVKRRPTGRPDGGGAPRAATDGLDRPVGPDDPGRGAANHGRGVERQAARSRRSPGKTNSPCSQRGWPPSRQHVRWLAELRQPGTATTRFVPRTNGRSASPTEMLPSCLRLSRPTPCPILAVCHAQERAQNLPKNEGEA